MHEESRGIGVAKMASHAIFQYNVLAIDDTHNTWTNMIDKMTILRLLGPSDDKEKIGVARPEGPPLAGLRAAPWKLFGPKDKNQRDREENQVKEIKIETIYYHRLNRR